MKNKKAQTITIIIIALVIVSLSLIFILIRTKKPSQAQYQKELDEFKELYLSKKAQGYDLSQVDLLIEQARQERDAGNIKKAYSILLQAKSILNNLQPPPVSECGNNICDVGENCEICEQDCGSCPPPEFCGDNVCDANENCSNCPEDCGVCEEEYCGDGNCDISESCSSCPDDCGSCPPPPLSFFEPIKINNLIGTFWTTTSAEINRLKNIGGNWSKPIFYWRAYKNDKTSYINQFDNYVSLIKNSNLEPIIVISGGNVPSNQDCLNKKHYLSDNSACTNTEFNAAIDNFVVFAEMVVEKYSQNVKIFQLMIEPNTAEEFKIDFEPEVFAQIMHTAYPRLKSVCQDCLFYPGGEAINPKEATYTTTWLYQMHSYSQQSYGEVYADLVAVHPFLIYDKPEDDLLELYEIYKQIGEDFNIKYNNKVYVFADEFAFHTSCIGGGDSTNEYPVGRWTSNKTEAEELQAKYWTRAILLSLSTNYVPRILWPPSVLDAETTKCCVQAMCNMGLCQDTGCLDMYWDNSGAYFSNSTIKKSGVMVKSLTNILNSYTFSRNLIQGTNGIYAIEFDKSGNKLIAVWNINGESNINLSPYLFTTNAKITHLITENTEIVSSSSVPISETPILVKET